MSPLEMRSLTVLEHSKLRGGVLETQVMGIIEQSAVRNVIWNKGPKSQQDSRGGTHEG
jgi:hypothetical protein